MLRRPVSARNFHRNSSSAAQRPTRDSPPIDAEFAHALSKRHPPRTIDRRAWPDVLPQPAGAKFFHRNSASARRAHSRPIDAGFAHAVGTPSPPRTVRPPRIARHAAQAGQREEFPSKLVERRTAPDAGFTANRRGIRTRALETPSPANNRPPRTACHAAQTGQCEGFPSKLGERRTAPDARIRGQSTRDSHAPSKRHPPRTIDRRA